MLLCSLCVGFGGRVVVAEVTSGFLTVICLNSREATQLFNLLNDHPTLMEDYPVLFGLVEGLAD